MLQAIVTSVEKALITGKRKNTGLADQPPRDTMESLDASGGYCRNCGRFHYLGTGNSRSSAKELMRLLQHHENIDIFTAAPPAPQFSTKPLFGEERGKMFGVLDCVDVRGKAQTLYAFSGQFAGSYQLTGWVPPLFNVNAFRDLTLDTEKQIKLLGSKIDSLPDGSDTRTGFRRQRRTLSRCLMAKIHQLYKLHNFRGENCSLADAFCGSGGIPTGTGDCCAPKLLNHAARLGLQPLGLCEFFWGRSNKSATMHHAMLTSACVEKCGPILGFMLCGLEDGHG